MELVAGVEEIQGSPFQIFMLPFQNHFSMLGAKEYFKNKIWTSESTLAFEKTVKWKEGTHPYEAQDCVQPKFKVGLGSL